MALTNLNRYQEKPKTEMDSLKFEAVNKSNWKDLQKLFEERGGPHNCWCMVWRNMEKGASRSKKLDKKKSLQGYIDNEIKIGLLCYDRIEPIAWCSIAPRDTYKKLGGDQSLPNVWSLVCFFIKRECRGKGLTRELLTRAENYARANGAEYIEAYPVENDSPSYRFMGFKSTFEQANYNFKHKAGTRRNVMIKRLV